MKKLSVYIIAIATLLTSFLTYADNGDVSTGSNNQLSIPSIIIGNTTYTGVVITVGSVLSVAGQTTTPTTLTVPFQAAMANRANNGFSKSYTISGWINNSTTNNPIPNTPISGSGTVMAGGPVLKYFTSGKLSGVSTLVSTTVSTGYVISTSQQIYNPQNYSLLGIIFGSPQKALYFSPYTIPATVQAGSTGSLGSGTDGSFIPTTISTVYSVANDTASTLLVTTTSTLSSPYSAVVTSTTYRIDTSGNINAISEMQSTSFEGAVYKVLNFTFS